MVNIREYKYNNSFIDCLQLFFLNKPLYSFFNSFCKNGKKGLTLKLVLLVFNKLKQITSIPPIVIFKSVILNLKLFFKVNESKHRRKTFYSISHLTYDHQSKYGITNLSRYLKSIVKTTKYSLLDVLTNFFLSFFLKDKKFYDGYIESLVESNENISEIFSDVEEYDERSDLKKTSGKNNSKLYLKAAFKKYLSKANINLDKNSSELFKSHNLNKTDDQLIVPVNRINKRKKSSGIKRKTGAGDVKNKILDTTDIVDVDDINLLNLNNNGSFLGDLDLTNITLNQFSSNANGLKKKLLIFFMKSQFKYLYSISESMYNYIFNFNVDSLYEGFKAPEEEIEIKEIEEIKPTISEKVKETFHSHIEHFLIWLIHIELKVSIGFENLHTNPSYKWMLTSKSFINGLYNYYERYYNNYNLDYFKKLTSNYGRSESGNRYNSVSKKDNMTSYDLYKIFGEFSGSIEIIYISIPKDFSFLDLEVIFGIYYISLEEIINEINTYGRILSINLYGIFYEYTDYVLITLYKYCSDLKENELECPTNDFYLDNFLSIDLHEYFNEYSNSVEIITFSNELLSAENLYECFKDCHYPIEVITREYEFPPLKDLNKYFGDLYSSVEIIFGSKFSYSHSNFYKYFGEYFTSIEIIYYDETSNGFFEDIRSYFSEYLIPTEHFSYYNDSPILVNLYKYFEEFSNSVEIITDVDRVLNLEDLYNYLGELPGSVEIISYEDKFTEPKYFKELFGELPYPIEIIFHEHETVLLNIEELSKQLSDYAGHIEIVTFDFDPVFVLKGINLYNVLGNYFTYYLVANLDSESFLIYHDLISISSYESTSTSVSQNHDDYGSTGGLGSGASSNGSYDSNSFSSVKNSSTLDINDDLFFSNFNNFIYFNLESEIETSSFFSTVTIKRKIHKVLKKYIKVLERIEEERERRKEIIKKLQEKERRKQMIGSVKRLFKKRMVANIGSHISKVLTRFLNKLRYFSSSVNFSKKRKYVSYKFKRRRVIGYC